MLEEAWPPASTAQVARNTEQEESILQLLRLRASPGFNYLA